MSPDLYNIIKQLCEEKQIPESAVVSTVELALAAAYRKDFADKLQNIKVELEPESGRFKVYDIKEVVEDVSPELREEAFKLARQKKKAALFSTEFFTDEIKKEEMIDVDLQNEAKLIEEGKVLLKFNPRVQITLSDAQQKFPKIKVSEQWIEELEVPTEFGRMAAQTAKQVIIQRIREAERETVFRDYKILEGKMVNGVVQRIEGPVVLIDIGKINAVLPLREQVVTDSYRIGQRLKLILLTVNMTSKGPEVIVSRAHRDLVKALFVLEVPEIESGTVEIKTSAREAGSRSKIAVQAHEENIDPIGSCIGQRGSRVTAVIDELNGEKIDIIEWNEDPEKFIKAALSPAKVDRVEIIDKAAKTAKVIVRPEQLSLAIGRGGQNVRLAVKLTGWNIDIVDQTTGQAIGPGTPASADGSAEVVAETTETSVEEKLTDDVKISEEESTDKS